MNPKKSKRSKLSERRKISKAAQWAHNEVLRNGLEIMRARKKAIAESTNVDVEKYIANHRQRIIEKRLWPMAMKGIRIKSAILVVGNSAFGKTTIL